MAKPTTTKQTMNKKRNQKVSSQPWIDEANPNVKGWTRATVTRSNNDKLSGQVRNKMYADMENYKKVIHKNMNNNVTIKKTLGGGYHKKWHYNEDFNEHTNIEFWSQWRKDNGYDTESDYV